METITHSLIGKDDLKTTPGDFEVTLADGRKVMMPPVQPVGWLDENFTKATLPSSTQVGRLTSVTDDVRGLWRDSGSQFVSIQGEILNARDFGALGDGTTDDYDALNAALTVLADRGGGVLFLPGGYTYKINTALIILTDGVRIIGAGEASILKPANGVTGVQIGDSAVNPVGCEVADLKVDGSNGSVVGVDLQGATNTRVRYCWFSSCGTSSKGAVHLTRTGPSADTGNVLIEHNRFNAIASGASGVRYVGATATTHPVNILNNDFVQVSGDKDGYGVLIASNGSTVNISGNNFENLMTPVEITANAGWCAMTGNFTATSNAAASEGEFNCPGNCAVSCNRFLGDGNSPYAIRIHTSSDATCVGNVSESHATGFLYLDGVTDVVVAINNTSETLITENGTVSRVTFLDGAELSMEGEVTLKEISAPSVSASGEGTIYFDSTSKTFQKSENGGVFEDLHSFDQLNQKKGADVASAAALPLGTDGNTFDITGGVTITSIVTLGIGTVAYLHFDAALVLTHHATDLILPSGANITTAAGDEATFIEYAAGDWRCVVYTRASGLPIVGSVTQADQAALEAETDEDTYVPPDLVKHSPGVAKAWGLIPLAGTSFTASYNMTSVSKGGQGLYDVVIATDFSSANYAIVAISDDQGKAGSATSRAAGTTTITMFTTSSGAAADAKVALACFGDQ